MASNDQVLVFAVYNNPVPGCGEPPRLETSDDEGLYRGYFENEHGEQWIFTYRRDEATGTLRGGDVGWDEAHVVNGGRVHGLALDGEESAWLATCWRAATALNSRKPAGAFVCLG